VSSSSGDNLSKARLISSPLLLVTFKISVLFHGWSRTLLFPIHNHHLALLSLYNWTLTLSHSSLTPSCHTTL
jgi:hypothetical protein